MNMKIETFNQAKFIREQVDHFNVKLLQLENIEKKEDNDFKFLYELAYNGIKYAISRLEEDFKSL